ncbi:MAG: nucleoside hydrolase [Thermoprotei archaeon]
MRKVVFDSDTASDDAVALACTLKTFDLLAVTIVAGNVSFERQVENALFTLDYFGSDAPVFRGARRPIMGAWRTVEEVHGDNGMGGWRYPTPKKKPAGGYAPDEIIRLSKEFEGELEILAVSPLTNLALAYLKDPEIAKRVKKVWVMGGAFSRGNTTQLAEYNFWVDPEAANIVFNAGFDLTVVPWEVAEEAALIDGSDWEKMANSRAKGARFFVKSNRVLFEYSRSKGLPGSVQPDSLTVAVAYDRRIVERSKKLRIDVETCGASRGGMLVDHYGLTGKPSNAEVVFSASAERFKHAFTKWLS